MHRRPISDVSLSHCLIVRRRRNWTEKPGRPSLFLPSRGLSCETPAEVRGSSVLFGFLRAISPRAHVYVWTTANGWSNGDRNRMRALAVLMALAIVVPADLSSAQAGSPPAGLFEDDSASAPISPIDEQVLADLDALGIQPASLCTDSVFVRRVYLDVIGTLPTPAEVKRFLEDGDPNKRRVLIDRLLERDEFADYWALKWCDLLRVKSEFPINLWPNAVQAYHGWVRRSIKENRPYDAFVRDLLTANGSNFRVPQVNFFRAVRDNDPETIAKAVALTFMGMRAENWPEGHLSAMAVFFEGIKHKRTGEWKEEIVFVDLLGRSGAAQPVTATFPDGSRVDLPPNQDRRQSSPIGSLRLITAGLRETSSTGSGTGCLASESSTNRTTSGPATRPRTRSCWHCSNKNL